jgi:hypothetical protein
VAINTHFTSLLQGFLFLRVCLSCEGLSAKRLSDVDKGIANTNKRTFDRRGFCLSFLSLSVFHSLQTTRINGAFFSYRDSNWKEKKAQSKARRKKARRKKARRKKRRMSSRNYVWCTRG